MSKIIIYDFEVFKYDTLLGALVLDDSEHFTLFQTWDLEKIKDFYKEHCRDAWIGWNNWYYDDVILETILNDKNPYMKSYEIVNSKSKYKSNLPFISYDLMNSANLILSLKLTELISGKNIHTSEVAFNIDRPLTNEEKLSTEGYNKDDLLQTKYNFNRFYDRFKLRLDIINEFNLPLKGSLTLTGTQLAGKVLKAKPIPGIEHYKIPPKLYPQLELKNETLKNFFLTERFRNNENDVIHIGNADINIGVGGSHSAIKKYACSKGLYFDVSGYYNLIMINFDLLPRTIPEEGKKLYEYMYHEQLRLKKINPTKRAIYKTILLSVFGGMNNEYTDFYDPQKFSLVTITGQLFICDLLEKLEDLVIIVQTNTDGIMVEPKNWNDEKKIISIVEEWEKRTGFVIKKEYFFDLYQRDVNCYVFKDADGKVVTKGEAVKNYDISEKAYSNLDIFNSKEPPIIAKGIVSYFIDGITPEELIEKEKDNLRMFQYVCKKNSYDYTEYEVIDYNTFPMEVRKERLQGIDRAFAYNSSLANGMVYKYKNNHGKVSKSKVSNLPPNVFIFDGDITKEENIKQVQKDIDYQYYIDRIYERLGEFINL